MPGRNQVIITGSLLELILQAELFFLFKSGVCNPNSCGDCNNRFCVNCTSQYFPRKETSRPKSCQKLGGS